MRQAYDYWQDQPDSFRDFGFLKTRRKHFFSFSFSLCDLFPPLHITTTEQAYFISFLTNTLPDPNWTHRGGEQQKKKILVAQAAIRAAAIAQAARYRRTFFFTSFRLTLSRVKFAPLRTPDTLGTGERTGGGDTHRAGERQKEEQQSRPGDSALKSGDKRTDRRQAAAFLRSKSFRPLCGVVSDHFALGCASKGLKFLPQPLTRHPKPLFSDCRPAGHRETGAKNETCQAPYGGMHSMQISRDSSHSLRNFLGGAA